MSFPTSSYAIAPPSPDSTTGSDCRSCCHPAVGCQPSSSKSQHALYALPSPPLSQGCQSPSCSSRSSSRRSSASGPSSGSRLAQPPTDDAFESTSPPSSTTTLPAKSHDEHDVLRAFGLDIDNRAQMDAFMRLETTESDCRASLAFHRACVGVISPTPAPSSFVADPFFACHISSLSLCSHGCRGHPSPHPQQRH